jgi:hypothetical protein
MIDFDKCPTFDPFADFSERENLEIRVRTDISIKLAESMDVLEMDYKQFAKFLKIPQRTLRKLMGG